MVDIRVATGAEQPIHSDGAVSTVTGGEGDLVGLDSNGELVAADAASGTAVPAIGLLTDNVDDPANYPTGQFEAAAKIAEANRNLINDDKASYIRYGAEIENYDADWGFTPGEPVYLATGGGFTQTKPSGSGEVQQRLGVAVAAEVIHLQIDPDYTTA